MTLIGTIEKFKEERTYPLTINDQSLLLIHEQQQFYLLKNQCGHFGVALNDTIIKDHQIICSQHGISFSLESGLVINRPYENCDPLKTYGLLTKNEHIYCLNL